MSAKISKGALVRLNDQVCFTAQSGGGRQFPLSNHHNDGRGVVESRRPVTPEETTAWYDSDASKGMTCDGETKLPPQSRYVELVRGRVYQVLRARCRVRLGYGNPTPGMAKILCTETGEETYVKRELIEVIS